MLVPLWIQAPHCSATDPAWACRWPVRVCCYLLASGSVPHASISVFFGNAPRGIPGRGCAPARRHPFGTRQKDAKARQRAFPPLASPPWGGVDGLRCFYRFSQAPSAPARESLREKFVGPTRSTRAAVPPLAGFPRVMPASSLPSPACPRSSAPRGPKRGVLFALPATATAPRTT